VSSSLHHCRPAPDDRDAHGISVIHSLLDDRDGGRASLNVRGILKVSVGSRGGKECGS
jgi:hypothetical protein